MRYGLLAVASLLSLSAQQLPDAASLLDSARAVQSGRSVRFTADMVTEVLVGTSKVKMPSTAEFTIAGPDRFRVETKSEPMGGSTVVADGKFVWTYQAALNRHLKHPASGQDLLAMGGWGALPAAADAKTVRAESIAVDGRQHDCWVIEARQDLLSTPGAQKMEMRDVRWTIWIDKKLGIDLKRAMAAKVSGGPMPTAVDMHQTATRRQIRFDETLADSLFEFTPPPGSTEWKVGADGTIVSAKAKAQVQAQAVSAGGVQAYVPFLTPLERTEPEWPAGVASKRTHEEVELLLTIDAQGVVTGTEVLSGHDGFREKAVATAAGWRFRPVIRNGQPVAAYTSAGVYFSNPQEGLSRDPASVDADDISAGMSLGLRLAELMQKFPRTKQQELADLVQDSAGAEGYRRFYDLGKLAKAAMAAGATEQAEAYANEFLAMAGEKQMSGSSGAAIHDGNMVLGLIALQRGNVERAKLHLLESGKTPGGPILVSAGPNMSLAKALLEKGEREAVLQYFSLCRAFWKMGADQLDAWSKTVREGKMPDLGAHLIY
jgi:TonB family protein